MRAGTAKRKPTRQHGAVVRDVKHLPHLSRAANDHEKPLWVWSYAIEIQNGAAEALTINERHWTIEPIGHAIQRTDGFGIGKGPFVIPPGKSRTYISGVPLPTPGGTMKGRFVGQLAGGRKVIIRVTVKLPAADPKPVKQATPAPDWRIFNRKLAAYNADCAKPTRAVLDAATLGEGERRAFEIFCLGQDGTKGFNTRKQGELKTIDIGKALGVPAIRVGEIQHTDIILSGDSLDEVSVVLIYDHRHIESINKTIKDIDRTRNLPFSADIMDDITQDYLQKSGLPRHLWAKTAHEIGIVKRVAIESDGKATAIRPPSLMPACVLEPEVRRDRTERQTRSKTKWRHNKRPEPS